MHESEAMETHIEEAKAQPQAAAAPGKKQLQLFVSDKAIVEIEKMQKKREAEGKPRALGLRVGIRGGGCTGFGYLFEWCDGAPRATDRTFEFAIPGAPDGSEKIKVFVDPKSLLYLDGTTLDFITSVMGHGFKFVNPNVKGTCGCGESVQF